MSRIFYVLLCAIVYLLGCSDSSGPDIDKSVKKVEGFVRLSATGDSVVLGTDDESAKASERNPMEVSFDYDFYLQKHEVTCGEFDSLMKMDVKCENDSLPMVNVSYYDAVLYANAKSKSEKRDTVYAYISITLNDDGLCTSMEGLVFHPEVDGYRLPTEAEWVYAAGKYWNVQNSWTADDEISGPQKVCSKGASSVCDLEGNVSEWVNDWMGYFSDSDLTDFVGASDGGSMGERVIKGGNYREEAKAIHTYRRGDTYMVTSSSRNSYVGFRLALGGIPNAQWLSSDGTVESVPVKSLASAASLRKFAGIYRAKLAFRNNTSGNLSYVDYATASLPVVEIRDTIDSYHPEISPDGHWVAFCTGMEGVSGKSSVYVRRLDATGSDLVKLEVESAAIPRWRVLENGDTVIVYVSDAGNNADESEFKKKSTWQVKFSEGGFGTPEKLLDGAYHDGVDDGFAVTGSTRLRVRKNGTDTVWYYAEQACNASFMKSGNRRVLFLDFGSETGAKFVGESYGVHERMLIADSNGNLVKSVAAPSGYAFDHTEWADENLAVATLTNANGNHVKVVAIRPDDSSMVELLEGDELWHPSLWVQKLNVDVDESLDLDSAAVYSQVGEGNVYLQYKLPLFWSEKDSLEVIGVGNSHMSTGFYADMVEHSLNMATVPCDIYCSSFLTQSYILNHCPNIKYVLVSIDFDLWKVDWASSLESTLGTAPGYAYDQRHDFWKDGLPKGFVELSQSRDVESDAFSLTFNDHAGYFHIVESNGWYDEDGTAEIVDKSWDLYNTNYEGDYQELLSLVSAAKQKGVHIIGIVFPMSPYYKTTDQYGRHGMRRSTAQELLDRLKEFDSEEEYFTLLDENKMGDHDYATDMAYDYDHLNYKGAAQLTQRLDSLFKTLE